MTTHAAEVAVVVDHPAIVGLGRTPREQLRVERFAHDLARWLVGEATEALSPLARVVVQVARRELDDPRRVCLGRPLLSVEAAARATAALWPLLRGPDEAPEPPPPPAGSSPDAAPSEGGGGGGGGSGGEGAEAGEAEEAGEGQEQGAEGEGDSEDESGDREDGDETSEGEADGGDEADGDGDGGATGDQPADPLDAEAVLQALANGSPGDVPDLDDLAERLREAMGGGAKQAMDRARDEAISGAVEANRLVRHLERFLPGVGWSVAPGHLDRALLGDVDRLVALLGRLHELERLADALGRMEGAGRKRGGMTGGSEEVVGVHVGGDVARALPSELGLLGSESTEDLFYQRLVERRLVSLELAGRGLDGSAEGDERGPVIACIDTSASMQGAPEMAAKALVLAITRRVLPRGRTVHLLLFGSEGEVTELRLKRGRKVVEDVLAFLSGAFHSGTDFDSPLMRAIELIGERELVRADVLVVTDGLGRAAPHVVERVTKAKQAHGVRVWSVVLGPHRTDGVAPFSDRVWRVDPNGEGPEGLLREL